MDSDFKLEVMIGVCAFFVQIRDLHVDIKKWANIFNWLHPQELAGFFLYILTCPNPGFNCTKTIYSWGYDPDPITCEIPDTLDPILVQISSVFSYFTKTHSISLVVRVGNRGKILAGRPVNDRASTIDSVRRVDLHLHNSVN